jgi:xanthine dehydrogenase YagR molybdenum-binding subunit
MATQVELDGPIVPGGIGDKIRRIDGPLKVTGAAQYPSDMPLAHPAYAYFHTSAIALGRITAIDEGEARAVPGVLDIMTWQNTAGQFAPIKIISVGGIATTSIMPLQSPDIRHDSEIVAVVLADSYEAAREASHRLKVTYEERTPTATFGDAGLTAEEAVKADPYFEDVKVGDAARAFDAAPVNIDQRYATPIQHHNPMELFTTTVQWQGDELTVYEPSQYLVGMQHGVAVQLKMDPAKVRWVSHFAGGAFGSKAGVTPRTALIALAAKRLNRPVKLVPTRQQGFTLANHRAETRHHVKLAANRDGKITAMVHEAEEVSCRADSYKVGGTSTTARMYAIPNIATKVVIQHADRDTPGFMRAPPEVPYMFALESAMDELAYALDMDPVELRRINDAQVEPIRGLPYSSRSLNQCYAAAAHAFGWRNRSPKPMSTVDGDWQVGWGCATAAYPSIIGPCFARVTLTSDGAKVEVAGHEMGTGAYTVYAQTASHLLGVPISRIEMRMGDSRLPPAMMAFGSSNTATICNAVALACEDVRGKLAAAAVADAKSPLAGHDPATLKLADRALRAPDGRSEPLAVTTARVGGGMVEALAGNEPKNVPPGSLAVLRNGQVAFGGGPFDKDSVKYAFGAEFVEVRVHRLTREVHVSRMVGAFAAGRIINPMTARNQLLGGMTWGVSCALHESTEIDRRTARYTNDNFAEYLIPVNADIPEVEVIFVPETDAMVNPLGIKGVGELGGVGTAAAVCNAIYHATGVRIRELPVRIEKIL